MIFLQLFYTFFYIGLVTFGGGYAMIPLITDEVVTKYGWITQETLTNFIGISESTPGPFAINIATFVGYEVAGIGGAALATIGVILPSLIIIIIIAALFKKFMNNRFVKGGLNGIKPIVVSLIFSTTIVLAIKLLFFNNQAIYSSNFSFDLKSLCLLITLVVIVLVYKFVKKKSMHPILVIALSALFGIIVFAI